MNRKKYAKESRKQKKKIVRKIEEDIEKGKNLISKRNKHRKMGREKRIKTMLTERPPIVGEI
jgi:hypothetical protein